MNTRNIVVSIVTSIIVVILAFSIFGGKTTERVVEKQIKELGAVSTLDGVDVPYVSIGGKKQYHYFQDMFATSSSICAIQNPFRATSTARGYTAQATSNGITGAQTLDLSTSTSAYASSSPALVKKFSTGTGQFSMNWIGGATTTGKLVIGNKDGAIGDSDIILGPTDWLTLKVASGTPGTFASYYTGTCSGVIEKL